MATESYVIYPITLWFIAFELTTRMQPTSFQSINSDDGTAPHQKERGLYNADRGTQ